MILGDRLDVIGSRFFLRLRLAKRERTTRYSIPSRLIAMPRPASQPIVMAQNSPVIAHFLGTISNRSSDTDRHRIRRPRAWHCF